MIDSMTNEINEMILSNLSCRDILSFGATCKKYKSICDNTNVWRDLVRDKFPYAYEASYKKIPVGISFNSIYKCEDLIEKTNKSVCRLSNLNTLGEENYHNSINLLVSTVYRVVNPPFGFYPLLGNILTAGSVISEIVTLYRFSKIYNQKDQDAID